MFEFITYNAKELELYTINQLNLIKFIIPSYLCIEDNGARNRAKHIIQNFLIRIYDSVERYKYQIDKNKEYITIDPIQEEKCIAAYTFIQWFIEYLFHSLQYGVSQIRLITTLEILHIFTIIFYKNKQLTCIYWKHQNMINNDHIKILFVTLISSYERIRHLSYEILCLFPTAIDNTLQLYQLLTSTFLSLSQSIRVRDTDAAALLLRLICNQYILNQYQSFKFLHIKHVDDLTIIQHNDINIALTHMFEYLSTILQSYLIHFKNISVINWFKDKNSINSIIKFILYITNDINWHILTTNIFLLLKNISQILLEILILIYNGYIQYKTQITNDYFIISSWLLIKEIMMILATWISNDILILNQQIFNYNYIQQIANEMMNILLKTKHNGLIEKTYRSFLLVCESIMRAKDNNLLYTWLNQFIIKINTITTDKNWIRRSAGLPYCFISILEAEPNHSDGILLNNAMNSLISTISLTTTKHWQSQVHALNIMRVIFQESALAINVMKYISKVLPLILKGFQHQEWAIRNASLLTCVAIFQRIKGNHHHNKNNHEHKKIIFQSNNHHQYLFNNNHLIYICKNGMTYHEFFSNFKEYQSYLIHKLTHSNSLILYPMLLFITNLTPSTISMNKNYDILIKQIQSVAITNHYYMIRYICAKSLCILIPYNQLYSLIINNFKQIYHHQQQQTLLSNQLNGLLLQNLLALQVIKSSVINDHVDINHHQYLEILNSIKLLTIINFVPDNVNLILQILQIISDLLIDNDVYLYMIQCILSILSDYNYKYVPGYQSMIKTIISTSIPIILTTYQHLDYIIILLLDTYQYIDELYVEILIHLDQYQDVLTNKDIYDVIYNHFIQIDQSIQHIYSNQIIIFILKILHNHSDYLIDQDILYHYLKLTGNEILISQILLYYFHHYNIYNINMINYIYQSNYLEHSQILRITILSCLKLIINKSLSNINDTIFSLLLSYILDKDQIIRNNTIDYIINDLLSYTSINPVNEFICIKLLYYNLYQLNHNKCIDILISYIKSYITQQEKKNIDKLHQQVFEREIINTYNDELFIIQLSCYYIAKSDPNNSLLQKLNYIHKNDDNDEEYLIELINR